MFQIMYAIKNLAVYFVLFFQASGANNDFTPLPKSPVNYRYFVERVDVNYEILGSCSEVKTTEPMSSCIVKIDHKYKPKYISVSFTDELVGTGIVIFKATKNGVPFVIILTAFHIVVPKLHISFALFISITCLATLLTTSLFISYYSFINYQPRIQVVFSLVLCSIAGSCIIYIFLLMIYPYVCDSLFQITAMSHEKPHSNLGSRQIDCQLISSKLLFSHIWKDDIGL